MPSDPAQPAALSLAADFAEPSREQWRELVATVLAKTGAARTTAASDRDPEDVLAFTSYDDIRIAPLYTAADAPPLAAAGRPGAPPFVRGSLPLSTTADGSSADGSSADGSSADGSSAERSGGWDVRVRHADPDPRRVSRAALEDLERGANSLWLQLGAGRLAVDDLATALDGVYLDIAPIVLDAGVDAPAAASALLALARQLGVDPTAVTGSLGADPIGASARAGAAADMDALVGVARTAAALPRMRVATIDASVYAEAGASDAQELGIGTAVGVAYLRGLVEAGPDAVDIDAALNALEFRWTVSADQFASIAKLRAARLIWDRVAELSGASAARRGQLQHAVTSPAILTRRDPWANMLRATIACFAAAVGGAHAITVAPFDSAIGVSDGFARRIARNTSAILHDESSLSRVLDAAGGSYYVESFTAALAERAWDVFTDVERSGGAAAALSSGTIGALLDGTRARRAADIATRRAPITGVSEFAFLDEAAVVREPLPVEAADRDSAGGLLPSVRHAAAFEALRDRSDAWLAKTGSRPRVDLVTIGPLSAHAARMAFATNLFATGGIDAIAVDEVEAGAGVTCLCGSDDGYAEVGGAHARRLADAGVRLVWLAGKAEVDGVDGCLFLGCDALAVLQRTFDALGVA